MIGKNDQRQQEMFIPGSLEKLIPQDHILKRVDRVLDLSWLRDEVSDCYCTDNGRPGIDPEAAVRLMIAGFLHGIVHDRKLMRDAQVNIAIRWFAGYGLEDTLPHHSSLTRIRQRWGTERFKEIFIRTVDACRKAGLVKGETLHVDATLIRADVSWESLTADWPDEVMRENGKDNDDDDKKKPDRSHKSRTKHAKKRSTTDPDATMTTSQNSFRMEPNYKQHTAVDDEAGVIVDIDLTTGEASEGEHLMEVIHRTQETLGRKLDTVTADAGYAHSQNYRQLEDHEIHAVIPPQKTPRAKSEFPISRFKYNQKHEHVKCPAGKKLTKRSRLKNGYSYRGSTKTCGRCPLREACVPRTAKVRTILILDGYTALLRARRWRAQWDEVTINWYRRHRWRVEGVHGEAKTQHGLRRAVRRGMAEVSIQVFLTAIAINLKKLAKAYRRLTALTEALWVAYHNKIGIVSYFQIQQSFLFY